MTAIHLHLAQPSRNLGQLYPVILCGIQVGIDLPATSTRVNRAFPICFANQATGEATLRVISRRFFENSDPKYLESRNNLISYQRVRPVLHLAGDMLPVSYVENALQINLSDTFVAQAVNGPVDKVFSVILSAFETGAVLLATSEPFDDAGKRMPIAVAFLSNASVTKRQDVVHTLIAANHLAACARFNCLRPAEVNRCLRNKKAFEHRPRFVFLVAAMKLNRKTNLTEFFAKTGQIQKAVEVTVLGWLPIRADRVKLSFHCFANRRLDGLVLFDAGLKRNRWIKTVAVDPAALLFESRSNQAENLTQTAFERASRKTGLDSAHALFDVWIRKHHRMVKKISANVHGIISHDASLLIRDGPFAAIGPEKVEIKLRNATVFSKETKQNNRLSDVDVGSDVVVCRARKLCLAKKL